MFYFKYLYLSQNIDLSELNFSTYYRHWHNDIEKKLYYNILYTL